MIRNYNEFISELLKAGFSGSVGGKGDGVFGLFRYGWGAEEETDIHWHTGNPDNDPWEWRIRVLTERNDMAYSKLFFRKAGYITKEFYPYFLAARRNGREFEDEYSDGNISNFAKRIYDTVTENNRLSVDEIKQIARLSREDKSKFDNALTELQMKMYLTMCDIYYKTSKEGKEYGFSSTVFCTTETFWGEDIFGKAAKISVNEAVDKITERILYLNSSAQKNKIIKFIKG
ncbi:MAG: hypothetical protein FWC09_03475 [Lachnospiraceae bacterium]|nr:hypothetical protein [Lachnospiraceae bacterium]